MTAFMGKDFLLTTDVARKLYHEVAADLPVIDYHSHLQQGEIAERKKFGNIAELWLAGDHYKWRLMRTAGVTEDYWTGERSDKERFLGMMRDFEQRALAVGTHFADNPSPGNIRDGLIMDAMKSAGAAKKGGTSPIVSVLDYGEQTDKKGLSLLCTPGGDVESVTGIVASGANVVLFSTGLGTPTGNPIVPILKISSNSRVAARLSDLIDYDCGPIIEGKPLPEVAQGLFDMVVDTASGKYKCKADRLQQYDFIFWKRDISL